MSDWVRVERREHVLGIEVDRQDKRNAWNLEIIRAVAEAYTVLRDDNELRAGVLSAAGEHFTAGLDLMDVLPVVMDGDPSRLLPPDLCDPWNMTGEPCPKPIVLAVQGRCNTLGLELALASQATVAASDTIFAQLEVARGIVPLGGGSLRLPSRLGARGMYWLLSADSFTAEEAMGAGLLTEIVEPGAQRERAFEIANRFAANAPLGVQAALASARAGERAARDAAAATILGCAAELARSADAAEGMASMIERREPRFRGA